MNLSNAKGNTALHEAVVGRNKALVALLLQNGALRHLRNERSCTPADCAEPVSAARACPWHGARGTGQQTNTAAVTTGCDRLGCVQQ